MMVIMMSTIFISLIPLAFKTDFYMFHIIDAIAVMIFIVDYFCAGEQQIIN